MFGWKEDAPDSRDIATTAAYQDVPTGDGVPSLRAYKRGYLYQNGFGACVGFAITRALHMSLLIEDERNGRPLSASMPSPGFIYYNARRQEAVEARLLGQADPPVIDKGCFPRLAMRAVQNIGFCREQDYPFSSLHVDIISFPSDNRKPPARSYMAAFDQRNLRYSRVYQTGSARRAEVERLCRAKVPLIFGMTVDSPFMRNRGGVIDTIDLSQKEGGHMMTVLETPEDGPVIDNWWGNDWGNNGEGQLSWGLFCSDIVRDIYAVEAAPAFSSEAP